MKIVALFLAFVALSANAQWEEHFLARIGVLQLQVNTAGHGNTLLLGDSNTEAFWWNTAGVCKIVNAGLGGATIRDVADRAATIADIARPRLVHIMVGTNNTYQTTTHPNWATMRVDLLRTVQAFWDRGIAVVLWPIPPVVGREDRRAAVNDVIAAVANERGVLLDWWWPETVTLLDLLPDGVHLAPSAQASRRARIDVWQKYLRSDLGVSAC